MDRIQIIIAIGLGGALGALSRYMLTDIISQRFETVFPMGTWVVNALGCLLIGFVFTLGIETTTLSPAFRAFFITGFLGAFTTFSTFSNESVLLFRQGLIPIGILYVLSSNVIGLLLVIIGATVAQWIIYK